MKNYNAILLMLLFSASGHTGGFSEGFEDINQLPGSGWQFDNRSDLIGDASWSQGFANFFNAQAGPDNSYLLGGVGQTAGNVLCDWLILPDLGFVEQLNFFTRTATNSIAADRLMVVHSPTGNTQTGPCVVNDPARGGSFDFGDFQLLMAVNGGLNPGGYPEQWTEFNVPVNSTGRLALVYFVEQVSQAPFNGNVIGIDSINIGPLGPQASPQAVPGLSLTGMLVLSGLMLLLLAANLKPCGKP